MAYKIMTPEKLVRIFKRCVLLLTEMEFLPIILRCKTEEKNYGKTKNKAKIQSCTKNQLS